MDGRKILKVKIAIATLGIISLTVVLWQFIMSDLAAGKRSAGTFGLGLIICVLIYGYVYLNFKFLKNTKVQIIFSGFNIIQTVSVGLIFLIGTIMFTIFLPHFIILVIGFALITFAAYSGMNFIFFDYGNDTVDGLLESGKPITFKNLQIDIQNDDRIYLQVLDSGEKLTLKKEMLDASNWIKIVENLSRIKNDHVTT